MSCQQLTTVCIFMTTCEIASGQFLFGQRFGTFNQFPRTQAVLQPAPPGYHYETLGHILNTYPINSYTIRNGLSNVNRNQNCGLSSPSNGGHNNPEKKKKPKDDEDDEDGEGDEDGESDDDETTGGNS